MFAGLTEKSLEGTNKRKAGFKFADPNGNGLCSLAEIENFVLQMLLRAYPKVTHQDTMYRVTPSHTESY